MFHVKSSQEVGCAHLPDRSSAREAVSLVLSRCSLHTPVQAALNEVLSRVRLSPQDKGLTTEIVYGYLRREISLHWLVSQYLKRPEKLPPLMVQRLACAAYELFCLDRIPAHATVDMAVREIRKQFGQSLARVANGVLRNLSLLHEQEGTLPHVLTLLTSRSALDSLCQLEITSGVPRWILSHWAASYDEETVRQLAGSASGAPWPCVRINRKRPFWREMVNVFCRGASQARNQYVDTKSAEGMPLSSELCGERIGFAGVRFPPGAPQATLRKAFLDGELSWQGGGSQLLLSSLLSKDGDTRESAPCPVSDQATTDQDRAAQHNAAVLEAPALEDWYQGKPFWDACAGHGGKSFALAELGMTIRAASDVNMVRLQGLRYEARRLHLPEPPLFCASAAVPPWREKTCPPLILLDAPCSGLGTLARRPDVRRLRQPEHLAELAALQKDLLHACWDLLPSGGRLVYMTCTVNPDENERQVRSFLVRHAEADLYREWHSRPDEKGGDLMYGAVLRKP